MCASVHILATPHLVPLISQKVYMYQFMSSSSTGLPQPLHIVVYKCVHLCGPLCMSLPFCTWCHTSIRRCTVHTPVHVYVSTSPPCRTYPICMVASKGVHPCVAPWTCPNHLSSCPTLWAEGIHAAIHVFISTSPSCISHPYI